MLECNIYNYMELFVVLYNSKGNGKLIYIGLNVIDIFFDIIIFFKDVYFGISKWFEVWYCLYFFFKSWS